MTKENLIKDLKEYKENVAKLKLRKRRRKKCARRLTQYKIIETSTTGILGINCDIHSKNQISNKVEKAALDTIELNEKEIEEAKEEIKQLDLEIEELKDKVEETKIRLSALNYKEKEILFAYYVEEQNYNYIGDKLYFRLCNQTRDEATIKRIIKKATNKMLNL